ncbi:MAG: phosphate ABC transporter permease subunit PstC [Acidobacteriia bacterium]|nr:phosphate ABC transporter permease subunit PstC [Terriglobia bacterium]
MTAVDTSNVVLSRQLRAQEIADCTFRGITFLCAGLVLVTMGAILVALAWGSFPALRAFHFSFFTRDVWNPVTDQFGAIAAIYGTLVTSAIALLFGVPISFGIAIFLTELAPSWLRRPIGTAIELLAAIPSIIYGMWGLFVFAPYFAKHYQPWMTAHLGDLPLVGALFQGPPLGIGVLTAGLILAVMIIPFISAIMRDVFLTVPAVMRESAYSIGATTWEVMWNVVLPYTRTSVIGAIMLGLGRALGETMAVTFVIGNAHHINPSLFMPGATISSTIANEFTEAVGDLYYSSLIALGLALFIVTITVLALAKVMLRRLDLRVR